MTNLQALEVLVDNCLAQDDEETIRTLATDKAEFMEWLDWWFGPANNHAALDDLQACGYEDACDAYHDILAIIRSEVDA